MLSSLRTAGYPVEYARKADETIWRIGHGLHSHLAYFWSLPSLCSTRNGVFGLKLLWCQLGSLVADIRCYTHVRAAGPREALAEWMGDPLYFWLRRRDRLRQAVSYARALQTDSWASPNSGNGATPTYSRPDIESALTRVSIEDEGWERYFDRGDIPKQVIWYEDLADDPGAVLTAITTALGLPAPERWRSTLNPQADALNDEWVERFRSSPGSSVPPTVPAPRPSRS
jgi:LPS sulfotransferase NodH